MEKGYPRQELPVPERMEPFPEKAPNSNIFEKGFLSSKTVKRLASWKGLKTLFYWSVKGLQAYHDVKPNFIPKTLGGRDISPLNPTAYDQHVKIPTAETKGQPDSHAGSQLEPKTATTAWEPPLESQKPSNGTSVPPKIQSPQPKQERHDKKKWNLPLSDTVAGTPRREWSDYEDEHEWELRQRHDDLIAQQNAVAREATEEFQAQQVNTTAPTRAIMQHVVQNQEGEPSSKIKNRTDAGTFQSSGVVANASFPIPQDHNTAADQIVETIYSHVMERATIERANLTGRPNHHRVRHAEGKLIHVNREIGREFNRWIKAECREYITIQQQAGIPPEKCDARMAKRFVRERLLRHLIQEDPSIGQLSKEEQNLRISQEIVGWAYVLKECPEMPQRRTWFFKPLQKANKPLVVSAARDVWQASCNSTTVEPSKTSISPTTTQSHNSTISSGNETLHTTHQTTHSTPFNSTEPVILPSQNNATGTSIMEQRLSNFKNLTQGVQFTEGGTSSRLSGTLALIKHTVEKWEQGDWEESGDSPLQAISTHLQHWILNLRRDYLPKQAQQQGQPSAECDVACTAELVREDVEGYLIKWDPSVAELSEQEKDILISKFIVDLAYTPLHENIISKYQERLKNGTLEEAYQCIQDVANEQWQFERDFTYPDDQLIFADAFLKLHAPFVHSIDLNHMGNVIYNSDDHVNELVGQYLASAANISLDNNTGLAFYEQLDANLAHMEPGLEKDRIAATMAWVRALINAQISGRDEEIANNLKGDDSDAQLKFVKKLIEEDMSASPQMKAMSEYQKNRQTLLSQIQSIPEFGAYIDAILKKKGVSEEKQTIVCGVTRGEEPRLREWGYTVRKGNATAIVTEEFQKDPAKNSPFDHLNADRTRYCQIGAMPTLFQKEVLKDYAQEIRKITALNVDKYKQVFENAVKYFAGEDYAPTAIWELKATITTRYGDEPSPPLPSSKTTIVELKNENQTKLLLVSKSESGKIDMGIIPGQDAAAYLLGEDNIKRSFNETSIKIKNSQTIIGPMERFRRRNEIRQEKFKFHTESVKGKTKEGFFRYLAEKAENVEQAYQIAAKLENSVVQPSLFRTLVNLFVPLGSCVLRFADWTRVTDVLGLAPEGDRKEENRNNEIGCAIDTSLAFVPVGFQLVKPGLKSGIKRVKDSLKLIVVKKFIFPSHIPSKKLVEQITGIDKWLKNSFTWAVASKLSPNMLTTLAIQKSLKSVMKLDKMKQMSNKVLVTGEKWFGRYGKGDTIVSHLKSARLRAVNGTLEEESQDLARRKSKFMGKGGGKGGGKG